MKLSEEQMKEITKSRGSSKYSDFVVKNGIVYGLEIGKSGYYSQDWDSCF